MFKNLYEYNCGECDIQIWVDWESRVQMTKPCCAECGQTDHMNLTGNSFSWESDDK